MQTLLKQSLQINGSDEHRLGHKPEWRGEIFICGVNVSGFTSTFVLQIGGKRYGNARS